MTEEKPINPHVWLFAVTPIQLGEELGSSEVLALEQAFARSWEQPVKKPRRAWGLLCVGFRALNIPFLEHPIPQL